MGALRLFNKDIKMTWKIKISDKENLINIKTKFEPVGKLYKFSVMDKSEFLNPLKFEDIAKKIDKDISSISRVVKNKYIDTPIGLVSLRSLFSNALIKKSGKAASSNELKKVILEIINSEDKNCLLYTSPSPRDRG